MARIRSVKPEFWTDGTNLRMSEPCALFFIGLWNFCDDEGKHPHDLDQLVAELGGRWHRGKLKLFISCLVKSGQLRINSDATWIQVTGWSHQKIDRPRQPSVKAEDIQWLDQIESTIILDQSRSIDARIGSDRIGKDRIGSDNIRRSSRIEAVAEPIQTREKKLETAAPKFDLELIFENYPKRAGDQKKKTGLECLSKKITTQGLFEKALRASQNYFKHCESEQLTGTKFVKQFSTFFGKDDTWLEYMEYTPSLLAHPPQAKPVYNRAEIRSQANKAAGEAYIRKLQERENGN